MGVNLHSLFANKHLEIRYHSGTLNPVKVLEWVNLHQRIIDLAVEHASIAIGYTRDVAQESKLEDKTQMLFDALQLDESSRAYFRNRQEMFADRREDSGEDAVKEPFAITIGDNTTELCAA